MDFLVFSSNDSNDLSETLQYIIGLHVSNVAKL